MKNLFLIFLIFCITSCGGNGGKAIDINNETAIIEFMQGQWTFDNAAQTLHFRAEIVGHKLRVWEKLETGDWKLEPTAERDFTLGTPTMDAENYYHVRYFNFDNGDLPMSFRVINPIWIVCDKDWGEPAILYGGGFTSFHRGWN